MSRFAAVLVVVSLLWAPPAALAKRAPGSSTANFLKVGVGPRPAAMAGAFTGLADDLFAIHYNPAGLGTLQRQQLAFMHHALYTGVRQEWAGYALPTEKLGTFAASVNMLVVSPFQAYDETDAVIGDVKAQDECVTFAYSKEVGKKRGLSAGVAVKYIRSTLDAYSATAIAFDGGVLARFGRQMEYETEYRLGAAVRNAGQNMKFIDEAFPLPQSLNVGVSRNSPLPHPFEDMRLNAALDAVLPNDDMPYALLGVELKIVREFGVRVGYRQDQDTGMGLTAGVGFTSLSRGFTAEWWPEISIDYSFVDLGKLEQSHRFGFTLSFGGGKRAEAETPYIYDLIR
ncbi:MAG: PorV/PorQ family protein [Elusimicrobiota bacterium]